MEERGMQQGGRMEEPRTVLSEDVEITGTVKCSSAVRLGGKLNGDLVCGSDVLVEKTSAIKGNLTVNAVVVLGQIKGNITAKDRIELKANARVMGDIKGRRLVVEEGAGFVGKSEITPSDEMAGDMLVEATPAPAAEERGVDELARGAEDEAAKAVPTHRAVPREDSRLRSSPLFTRK